MAVPSPVVSASSLSPRPRRRPSRVMSERRDPARRQQLSMFVQQEFTELPTLCLTVAQAARLFGTSTDVASRVLAELAARGVLRCTSAGLWVRWDRRV